MSDAHHFTYSEWLDYTVNKIVMLGLSAPEKDRDAYLRVQIRAAILQSLAHGRSGRTDNDPVVLSDRGHGTVQ